MEEVRTNWQDSSDKIRHALEFLDDYFGYERPDDKTARQAYQILRLTAQTFINLGNRLSDPTILLEK